MARGDRPRGRPPHRVHRRQRRTTTPGTHQHRQRARGAVDDRGRREAPRDGHRPRLEAAIRGGMSMREGEIIVMDPIGLHARPAAQLVALANEAASAVRIRNVTTSSQWVDAKSILNILALGAEQGHAVALEVDGLDADAVFESLVSSIEGAESDG